LALFRYAHKDKPVAPSDADRLAVSRLRSSVTLSTIQIRHPWSLIRILASVHTKDLSALNHHVQVPHERRAAQPTIDDWPGVPQNTLISILNSTVETNLKG
jgi:hypothetical protein